MEGRGFIAFFNVLGTIAVISAVAIAVITGDLENVIYSLIIAVVMFSLGKFAYSRLPEDVKQKDRDDNEEYLRESDRLEKQNYMLKNMFVETDRIGQLSIDDKNGLFKFNSIKNSFGQLEPKIFEKKNFVSYVVKENGSEVVGGGVSLKRAVVGHLVAGPAGMVLGGLTGTKKSKSMIDTASLTFSMVGEPFNKINLIKKPVEAGSVAHQNAVDELNGIIDYFESILEENRPDDTVVETQEVTIEKTDSISLLREYKMLLDEGVINQREFDIKKKELL